ncbi:helix-turn-helix domain-containing protein [Bradyrhizobium manausense]|uniref:Helix-turn-helix domain-containing protein n=1 Tax=Bradyrhizobium manausense TaxID=989370 RepID=A0A0R3DGY1_9BRAD|nr:helix-turn-helix domain-containing protein [Bradyrhizobium manausense]KRQ09152.1 hypothetical protein AOQ71_21215 [Bradyrhizobium manausense]
MRNRDAQVRELFSHIRRFVDILEDIALRPLPQEVEQRPEARPPAQDRPVPELPQKLAYSIKEVLELCAISRASLYVEIGKGRLRVVKRGHRSLILAADLQEWMSKWSALRT